MTRTRYAIVSLLTLLAACGGSESADRSIAFRTIEKSNSSNIVTAEQVVVRSSLDWQPLWSRHVGPLTVAAPPIDFSRHQVIAVFLGGRPLACQFVTIEEVVDRGLELEVRFSEHKPGPTELCATVPITPAHLVEVPRTELPVVFVEVKSRSS